ncbi:MAG: D-glycero-beta-D-manno-heptose-7-phosphate kinase [Bdellovibrionia bacterium]
MAKTRKAVQKKSFKNYEMEMIRPEHWERGRLREILRRKMPRKKVLVIGDVGMDRYTIGLVERISPEAPVPIVLVEDEQHKLGLAANVADNVSCLGGIPLLVGIVGADRIALDFKKLLKVSKIPSQHLIEDAHRRTVLKERIVSDRQQLVRVDYETVGPISQATEAVLLKKVKQLLPQADCVILEDYAKGLLSAELAEEIFALARKAGKFVAVDPNMKTPVGFYRGASVLTPNTKEAEKLSGISIYDNESLLAAGSAILKATDAEHVVITRGKDGMAIFSKEDHRVMLIPTYAREVYDVSGAGDTVISVLALAMAGGASVVEAAILGNLAAGVEVGKRGTATVTPDEVEVALEFFGAMGISQ